MSRITEQKVLIDKSAVAAENLEPYRAVVINSDGEAQYPTTAGVRADGFVIERFGVGERVQIVTDGLIPVKIATAAGVERGVYLSVTASGGQLANIGSEHEASAIADADAGANGDLIQARVSDLIRHTEPA